jgi:hypothetical protein
MSQWPPCQIHHSLDQHQIHLYILRWLFLLCPRPRLHLLIWLAIQLLQARRNHRLLQAGDFGSVDVRQWDIQLSPRAANVQLVYLSLTPTFSLIPCWIFAGPSRICVWCHFRFPNFYSYVLLCSHILAADGGGRLQDLKWVHIVTTTCHTQFLCQNHVLIICMTQDQLFHTYGQKCL